MSMREQDLWIHERAGGAGQRAAGHAGLGGRGGVGAARGRVFLLVDLFGWGVRTRG